MNKPALTYKLNDGTEHNVPFEPGMAVNKVLCEIWQTRGGQNGMLIVSNLPIFQGDGGVNRGEVVHGEGKDWAEFAEKAFRYIRECVTVYHQVMTPVIKDQLACVDVLIHRALETDPTAPFISTTYTEKVENPLYEAAELLKEALIEFGWMAPWRLKVVKSALEGLRIRAINNSTKDEDKICMVAIQWKALKVNLSVRQNQTYLRVTKS